MRAVILLFFVALFSQATAETFLDLELDSQGAISTLIKSVEYVLPNDEGRTNTTLVDVAVLNARLVYYADIVTLLGLDVEGISLSNDEEYSALLELSNAKLEILQTGLGYYSLSDQGDVTSEYFNDTAVNWKIGVESLKIGVNRTTFEQDGVIGLTCDMLVSSYEDDFMERNMHLGSDHPYSSSFISFFQAQLMPSIFSSGNLGSALCSAVLPILSSIIPTEPFGESISALEFENRLYETLDESAEMDLIRIQNSFFGRVFDALSDIVAIKDSQDTYAASAVLIDVLQSFFGEPTQSSADFSIVDVFDFAFNFTGIEAGIQVESITVDGLDSLKPALNKYGQVSFGLDVELPQFTLVARVSSSAKANGTVLWDEQQVAIELTSADLMASLGVMIAASQGELFDIRANELFAKPLDCLKSILVAPINANLLLNYDGTQTTMSSSNAGKLSDLVKILDGIVAFLGQEDTGRMVAAASDFLLGSLLSSFFDENVDYTCPAAEPITELIPNGGGLVFIDNLNDALAVVVNQPIGYTITDLNDETNFARHEVQVYQAATVDEVFPLAKNALVTGVFDYLNGDPSASNCTAFDLVGSVVNRLVSGLGQAFGDTNGDGTIVGGNNNTARTGEDPDFNLDGVEFTFDVDNETSLTLSLDGFRLTGIEGVSNLFSLAKFLTFEQTTIGVNATIDNIGIELNATATFSDAQGVKDEPITMKLDVELVAPELILSVTLPFLEESVLDVQFGSLWVETWKCILSTMALPPAFVAGLQFDRLTVFAPLLDAIKPLIPKLIGVFEQFLPELVAMLFDDVYDFLVSAIAVIEDILGQDISLLTGFLLDNFLVQAIVNQAIVKTTSDAKCTTPALLPESENTFNFVQSEAFNVAVEVVDTCFLNVLNTQLIPAITDEGSITLVENGNFTFNLNNEINIALFIDATVRNLQTLHDVVVMDTFPTISDYLIKNGLAAGLPTSPLMLVAGVDYSVNDGPQYALDIALSIDEIKAYLTLLLEINRNRVNARQLRKIVSPQCWLGDLHTGGLRELLLDTDNIGLGVTCRECGDNSVLEELAALSGTELATKEINNVVKTFLNSTRHNLLESLETIDQQFIQSAREACENGTSNFQNASDPISGALELIVFVASGGAVAILFAGCTRAYKGKHDSEVNSHLDDSLLEEMHLSGNNSKSKMDPDLVSGLINLHQLRVELVDYLMDHDEERADQAHIEELVNWTVSQGGDKAALGQLSSKMETRYGKPLLLSDEVTSVNPTSPQLALGAGPTTPSNAPQNGGCLPTTAWDYRDTSALCFHPGLPTWLRFVIPISFLVNLGFFVSGDLQQGARVDLLLQFLGSEIRADSYKTFSLANSVVDLWNAGAYPLALLIATLSGAWPYLKILLMSYCWFRRPSHLSLERRTSILKVLDMLGKFALVEVFFLVLVLSTFRVRVLAPEAAFLPDNIYQADILVTPIWGLYAFLLASVLSLVTSNIMLYYDLMLGEIRDLENEVRLAGNKERHQELVQDSYESVGEHVFHVRHEGYNLTITKAGRRVWFILSILFGIGILVGAVVPAIFLDVTGILRNVMELAEDANDELSAITRQFSVVSLAKTLVGLIGNAPDAGALFGTLFVLSVYLLTTIIFPITRILYVAHGFFNYFTVRNLRKFSRNVEILSAWCGLEVFLISILVGVLEIGQVSEFLLDKECKGLIPTLDLVVNDLGLVEYEGDRISCFRLRPSVRMGSFILVGASLGSYILMQIALSLIHEALEQRTMQRIVDITGERKSSGSSSSSPDPTNKTNIETNCSHSFVSFLHSVLAGIGLVKISAASHSGNPRFASMIIDKRMVAMDEKNLEN